MIGVLLDLDGTLIDSNEAHARAWMEALAEAGIPVEYADVREKIGEGGDLLLPNLTGIEAESELGRRIQDRRAEIFRLDFLPRLRALPGARALLRLFQERGVRAVAATSGSKKDAEMLLKQAQLDDLIPELVTGDDVATTKPAPDLVVASLGRMGLPARDAILLGDTPYDVVAACRAGVRAVAFTCGGWPADKLAAAGARTVYQGPWELLAAFDRSPFAAKQVAA